MREIKFRLWDHEDSVMVSWDQIKARGFYISMLVTWPHLCQYTGLKDKNDKEIYEGDIVKDKWYTKVVEYDGSGYYPFAYYGGGEMSNTECEVIGNIFENPID